MRLSEPVAKSLQLLLLALIGLAAYSNAFHTPFFFDDLSSIVENPVITDLGRFLSGEGYAYNARRVVGYFTFALNYSAGGLDPFGYHVVNLAIHVACAWSVYLLVRTTLKTPFFAGRGEAGHYRLLPLAAALLFVSHPVQTQAVTYLVQRLASLATLFYLLSLFCYARGRLAFSAEAEKTRAAARLRTVLYFVGSLLCALLAFRTKEITATLPLVVLLYEFSFFKGSRRRNLLLAGGLVLFALGLAAAVLSAGRPLGELLSDVNELSRETRAISRGEYLLTQFGVIATYLRLLVLPVNQNLDYHYPIFSSLFEPRVFSSFALLIALFSGAVFLYLRSAASGFREDDPASGPLYSAQGARLVAFGIFWFFVTLSVESSVIPIADVIFEHRLYLPSVGAFTALAGVALLLARRLSLNAVAVGFALVSLILAVVTWQRNLVWESPLTLWGDVVAKSPDKSRPNNQYGVALYEARRPAEAVSYFRKAIAIRSNNSFAYYNLGRAYDELGELDAAIAIYQAAIAIDPGMAQAHNNLAVDYLIKGDDDQAIERYKVLLAMQPGFAEARNNLGFALFRKGKMDEAISEYRAAIEANPGYGKAYLNLGEAYLKMGDLEQAIGHFQEGARLRPNDPAALELLEKALSLKQAKR